MLILTKNQSTNLREIFNEFPKIFYNSVVNNKNSILCIILLIFLLIYFKFSFNLGKTNKIDRKIKD